MQLGEISIDVSLNRKPIYDSLEILKKDISRLNITLTPKVNTIELRSQIQKSLGIIPIRVEISNISGFNYQSPISTNNYKKDDCCEETIRGLSQLDRSVNKLISQNSFLNKIGNAQRGLTNYSSGASVNSISNYANYGNYNIPSPTSLEKTIAKSVSQGFKRGVYDIQNGNIFSGIGNLILAPVKGATLGIGELITMPIKTAFRGLTSVIEAPFKGLSAVVGGVFQGFGNKIGFTVASGFMRTVGKNKNQLAFDFDNFGSQVGRYSTVRGGQIYRSVARGLNYQNPSDFGRDIKRVAAIPDILVDPRKLQKAVSSLETGLAWAIDKALVQGKPVEIFTQGFIEPIKNIFIDSFNKIYEYGQKATEGIPKAKRKEALEFAKAYKEKTGKAPTPGQVFEQIYPAPKREFQALGLAVKAASIPLNFYNRVTDFEAQRQITERAKKLPVPDLTGKKAVTIVTGGFQEQRGKGAHEIGQLASVMFPNNAIIPVQNTYTDRRSTDKQSVILDFLKTHFGFTPPEAMINTVLNTEKLVGTSVRGSSPDAIRIAAQIKAIRDKYPDIPIGATTFSGGTYPLEQAIQYATQMNLNAKGVGTGAGLYGLTGYYNPNYQAMIGEEDPLSFPFKFLLPTGNTSIIPNFSATSSMDVHNPKRYFANPIVQQAMSVLPGYEGIPNDLNKDAQESIFTFYNRKIKLEKNIQRGLDYVNDPNAKLNDKTLGAYTDMSDALDKLNVFSDNVPAGVASKVGALVTTDFAPVKEAQKIYAQMKQVFAQITQKLGEEFKIPAQQLGNYTPEQATKVIQAIGKVRAETPQLERTIDRLGGAADTEDYAFYTRDAAQAQKRLNDLHGLIKYLENNTFKDLPGDISDLATEYLAFLKEIETNIEKIVKGTGDVDPNLFQQKEKLYMLGGKGIAPNKLEVRKQNLSQNSKLNSDLSSVKQTISSLNAITENEGVTKAKEIAIKFSVAYAELKEKIKNKSDEEAINLAKIIEERAQAALDEISEITKDSVDNPIGSRVASQLANTKSRISRIRNETKRNINKAGLGAVASQNITAHSSNIKPKTILSNEPLKIPNGQTIGVEINRGIKKGLEISQKEPIEAIQQTAEEIIKTAKGELEIQSPSKVFYDIGKNIIEGLQNSLHDGLEKPREAIVNIVQALRNPLQLLENNFDTLFSIGSLVLFVNTLKSIAPALRDAAIEMEQFQLTYKFAVAPSSIANRTMNGVIQSSQIMGLDIRQSLKGYSDIASSTKDTALEGYGTQLIYEGLRDAAVARQLPNERYQQAAMALTQISSKGNLSMEEFRQQLAEALPGSFQIAARSAGMTPQEFTQKASSLTSEEFLPKFAQALSSQAAPGLEQSADSSQAAITRLNNAIFLLQANFGKPLISVEKLGLNALVNVLNTLVILSPAIINLGATLSLMWGATMAKNLFNAASSLGLFNAGWNAALTTGKALIPVVSSVISKFLLFTTIVESIKLISTLLGSSSEEMDNLGKSTQKAIDKFELFNKAYEEKNKSAKKQFVSEESYFVDRTFLGGLAKSRDKNNPDDFGANLGYFTRRAITKFENGIFKNSVLAPLTQGRTFSQKVNEDQINSTKKVLDLSKDTTASVRTVLNDPNSALAETNKIDNKLSKLSLQRRGLIATKPEDAQTLKEISKQEEKLLKIRQESLKAVTALQNANQTDIDNLKSSIKILEEAASVPGKYQEEYKKLIQEINEQLIDAEKAQTDLNRAVKNGLDSYLLLTKRVQNIQDRLTDYKSNIGNLSNDSKLQIANLSLNQSISPTQAEYLNNQIDSQALVLQVQKTNQALTEMASLLNEKLEVLSAYGLNANSGSAEINTAAGIANDKDKPVLEKFSQYKELQTQYKELQLQLAQSQASTAQQIRESAKAYKEYFREITLQTESLTLETKLAKNSIALNAGKLKLREALQKGQSTFVESYVESLTGIIETLNKPQEEYLRGLIQNNQAYENLQQSYKRQDELRRNLPVNANTNLPVNTPLSNTNVGASNAVASPLAGVSLEKLVAYKPSPAQGFFGVRDGGKRRHSKVDFDSRVGGGQGAVVQATMPGIATWYDLNTGNSAGINIKSKDAQGRDITQVYNHLSIAEVKRLFGGQKSMPVQAGQRIGTVTMDALSTGAHLDYGIKINGSYVDPQKYIKDYLIPLQKNAAVNSKPTANTNTSAYKLPDFKPKLPPNLKGLDPNHKIPPVWKKKGGTNLYEWFGGRVPEGYDPNPSTSPEPRLLSASKSRSQTSSQLTRGGNLLTPEEESLLSPLGKELYALQRNPNVVALGNAIARAEGTDFRSNSDKRTFGYDMLVGGGKFKDFSTHPFVGTGRKYIHNSSASGRYQMMDFNYANVGITKRGGADMKALFKGGKVPSFSPAVQDLYFTSSLRNRGALDAVLAGNFVEALKADPKGGVKDLAHHYASIERSNGKGAYGGQYNKAFGSKSAILGFIQNQSKFLTPQAKQVQQTSQEISQRIDRLPTQDTGIDFAKEIEARRQDNQNYLQIVKNIEGNLQSENKLSAFQAQMQKKKASAQMSQAVKEQAEQLQSLNQKLDDDLRNVGANTLEREFIQGKIDVQRSYESDFKQLSKLYQEQKDAEAQLITLYNVVQEGNFPGADQVKDQLPDIFKKIEQLKKTIAVTEKTFPKLERVRDTKLSELNRKFGKDTRNRQIELDDRELEILAQRYEARADQVEAYQQGNMGDLSQGDPLLLRSRADRLRKQGSYAKQQRELEETLETNPNAGQQIAAMRANLEIMQREIFDADDKKLTRELMNRQLQIEERELSIKEKINEQEQERNNYLIERAAITKQGNPEKMKIQSEIGQGEILAERAILDKRKFAFENNLSVEETEKLIDGVKELNSLKLDGLRRELRKTFIDQLRTIRTNRLDYQNRLDQYNVDINSEEATRFDLMGLTKFGNDKRKANALSQNQTEYFSVVDGIYEYAKSVKLSTEDTQTLLNKLKELNNIKLDNIQRQFDPWHQVAQSAVSSLSTGIQNVITGSSSLGDAFMQMGATITDTLAKLAAEWLTNELVRGLFGINNAGKDYGSGGFSNGILGGLFGGLFGKGKTPSIMDFGNDFGSSLFGILGFSEGGLVPTSNFDALRNTDTLFGKALRKEGAQSIIAALTPGERVLTVAENRLYELLHPRGIKYDYPNLIPNYNDGGVVGQLSNSGNVFNNYSSVSNPDNLNLNVNVNSGSNDLNEKEIRLTKAIQSVVISEIKRQKQPGGILSK